MSNPALNDMDRDDGLETAQLRAAIEEARAETDSVPHERVREWLLALAEGRRIPPPHAVASFELT